MANYDISANITANTKGYEAGINKVQKTTKSFSASLSKVIQGLGKNGLVGAMGSIGLASAGLTATLGAVVKIAKNVAKAIDECTEAYKKQNIAEIALKTAMDNNPLTNGKSTKQLREFASEMQRTSNLGDEEIIPFMTQLIASGRTEAETMKIIKTASDMASSGAMSFDTAITQLNATLNGNVGRLGQQNAELKGLTKEELENGKAVDILAEKYKGLTEATLDTKKKLSNAIGDLRESFGSVFEKALSPMRNFFAEIIQGWADARKAKQEYEGAVQAVASGNADIEQLQIVIDANEKKLEDFNKVVEQKAQEFQKDREEIIKNWVMYLNSAEVVEFSSGDLFGPKQAEEIERQNYLLNGRIRLMNKINEAEEKAKQKRAEGEVAEAERLERDKKANELKEEYLKKIAEQEARWRHIKEVTGESVSNEEKMKYYQDALVDLMTKSGRLITTDNELYKEQMAIIKRLQSAIKPEEEVSEVWTEKLRKQLIDKLEMDKEFEVERLKKEKATDEEILKIKQEYNNKALKLELAGLEEEKEKALKSVEGVANENAEKLRIQTYYAIEREKIEKKYNLQIEEQAEESGKTIGEKFAQGLKVIQKTTKFMANEFTKAFSNISKLVKGLFSGGKSIFTKLFDLNLDTALEGLLKVEDKILTFFVETLPNLPKYLGSALQSVGVLLENLLQIITPEKISDIIIQIMQTITSYAPTIIQAIGSIMTNMLQGIIDSLPQILDTMGTVVEEIAKMLPKLLQKLIDLFIGILQNPTKVVDIVKALIMGFVEIVKVLARNIGPLLDALLPVLGQILIEIIKALPDLLSSLANAVGDAIATICKWVVNMIIDGVNLLLDGISKIWTWIPNTKGIPHIPHLATGTDNAQKGLALVGEAGPELIRFNGGEQVLNTRNTQKALANTGDGGSVFNVTFNNTQDTTAFAMMKQLKSYQRNLAFNSVI